MRNDDLTPSGARPGPGHDERTEEIKDNKRTMREIRGDW